MNSYRKPLFWGMVLLLVFLVCCATSLCGYLVLGQPIITAGNPSTNETSSGNAAPGANNVQATLSALYYEQNKYMNQNDTEDAIKIAERAIATDPNNPMVYVVESRAYRLMTRNKTNLNDYKDLLDKGLVLVNKGISLDPKMGDLYAQRGFLYESMTSEYAYRVDRETLYGLALADLKTAILLKTAQISHPERGVIFYEYQVGDCNSALSEATRQATAEPYNDNTTPSTFTDLEYAYACEGDYQKALDYHNADLKQTNNTDEDCGCEADAATYLYQLGKKDEAFDLVNKSILKKPNYGGVRFFIRAVIEFDQGKYQAAEDDSNQAEGNSWAFGKFNNYIEGLNAERLGNTQEAITKLQYAEATLGAENNFAILRARAELEKMGAAPLVITPSVSIPTTVVPVETATAPNQVPTYDPNLPTK